jgi:DNA-binding PadR family transcriptional regulator
MNDKGYRMLQSFAHRCLAVVYQNGVPTQETIIIPAEGKDVRVELRISSIKAKELTECEQAMLNLLCAQVEPRTQNEIRRDAEESGLIFGFTTIRNALSALRKRGYIDVGSKGGYTITERGESVIRVE